MLRHLENAKIFIHRAEKVLRDFESTLIGPSPHELEQEKKDELLDAIWALYNMVNDMRARTHNLPSDGLRFVTRKGA